MSENKRKGNTNLGDYWLGIQLYYPPVKYAPSLGIYEDMKQAAARMVRHAHYTIAHTLIFDLEDGCRQKEMSEFSYYLSQSQYRPIQPGSAGFPQP